MTHGSSKPPNNHREYVINRLEGAMKFGSSPFNWYFQTYTRIFDELVAEAFYGKIRIGFVYKGHLFTHGPDLLICLGEIGPLPANGRANKELP